VLGSYNRKSFLVAAIESVRAEADIAAEIIVVDGGSSDGSLEWLVAQKDIITIVQHNRGEFRGNPIRRRSWGYFMNLGFKAAQGRWVCMISDDCVLLPGALAAAVRRADELDSEDTPIGGVAFYFRNWPADQSYYVQETVGAKLMVNHGLYRREALEAVGFADEDHYVFYKADGDLSLRLWEAGFSIIDSPGSIVEHHMDDLEAIRLSNNTTLERDRASYHARWHHLTGAPSRRNSDFVDSELTAERVFGRIRTAAGRSE
jgi:GT2 family glycosyltransferase